MIVLKEFLRFLVVNLQYFKIPKQKYTRRTYYYTNGKCKKDPNVERPKIQKVK